MKIAAGNCFAFAHDSGSASVSNLKLCISKLTLEAYCTLLLARSYIEVVTVSVVVGTLCKQ
eukprot:19951-Heterococcus_DN1.PRE.1